MATEVKIPEDLWEEDQEAALTAWLVSDGASVSEGTLLAEIMTAKVQHEIEAPADGTIKLQKKVDDVVAKGDVIAVIE
ncbi:MAG: lipoyl domain-containing protein [Pseudomonadota bacterium]